MVIPGEELGVEEEYLPGENAYIDDAGFVRSMVLGVASWDLKGHTVSVKPIFKYFIRQNQTVYGLVYHFPNPRIALVRIFALDVEGSVKFIQPETGILHISNASDERLQSIYDAVGLGDLVKARVLSSKPPYHLSIRTPQLGVLKARCPRCRAVIVSTGPSNRVTCPVCGLTFRRKMGES